MDLQKSSLTKADLSEQTYLLLRDSILKRQLAPGSKIHVDDIAKQLGVSRTPVLDALKRLAGDGLVEIRPRRGTFVTELSAQDVTELFEIRRMIENFAIDHIFQGEKIEQFLFAAEEPVKGMEEAMVNDEYGDYEVFLANDRDFHLTLVEQTGNEHLIHMYVDLNVHLQIARAHYLDRVELAAEAHSEHQAILTGFTSGTIDETKEALHSHISNVQALILRLVEEHGGSL